MKAPFLYGTVTALTLLLADPVRAALPIPPEVKSVVAFIYVRDAKGALVPNGTGFFVGVPSVVNPDWTFVYLVTAKHVLRPSETAPGFFPEIHVRLNRKTGNALPVPIALQPGGAQRNVFVHSDPTVDLAVLPLAPDQDVFDVNYLPVDIVTTPTMFSELNITEGTDVFFTGLFLPHAGVSHNLPIVRFGRVAMVSNEKVDWNGQQTDLYLIESASFGGNSGSPVFFYLGADRSIGVLKVGPPILRLAGIMRGSWSENQPIGLVETGSVPVSKANLGIALVTPAFKLHELLFGNELSGLRATTRIPSKKPISTQPPPATAKPQPN